MLHPEHLYNAMDHHYEMMRVSSIIYATITWLNFPIICILNYACHCTVCMQAIAGIKTVDNIVQIFCLYKRFLVLFNLITYMFGTLSGHVGLCLDNAWLYI